ncbi:MAG: XdhC family protein [Planctomycetia bacterium]|nr:XdhC family protein [Planctomycetia bacterium]
MSRDELSEMIGLAERLLAAGEPAVLATLFSADGSTYRTLGSMMVSGPGSGFIAGGVSGGCLEEYIARRGRELIERYDATMLSFDTDPDSNDDGVPSLGCGGSIEVLVERCTPEHLTFLRRLSAAQSADVCSAVACVIDPAELPALTVRRSWFDQDDGIADQPLEALRRRAITERRSRHGEVGGSCSALVHYVRPLTRLVLLGAGNDARPLCKLARSLGWHVTVADRRARLATQTRFPDADQVIAADWWNALKEIVFTPQTAVVVMTHSVNDDVEILPLLSEQPAVYVGVLGPEHRLGWVLRDAQETSMLSDAFISRLRGPIGLDLGERTPEGIAISIASEIMAELHGRTAIPLSQFSPRACTAASDVVDNV